MKRSRRIFARSKFSPTKKHPTIPPTSPLPPRIRLALTEPHQWYQSARRLNRRVICHIGPTNSGKTHAALKALKAAPSGIYCGPLRLLAWEVSNTLRQSLVSPYPDSEDRIIQQEEEWTNTSGPSEAQKLENEEAMRCDLVTGQELDLQPGARHVSCTVEMCPLDQIFSCAVLDEAQLLGDPRRGWAWTQAFLGLQAEELHLCGSPSFLPLVRELCHHTKDNLEVREYPRLSPLSVSKRSLDSYRNIERGDCVIAFSKKQLFRIKAEIEHMNPALKCGIIYGSLPPDVRRQQAKFFNACSSGTSEGDINDDEGKTRKERDRPFDVLVASDAVGMGLNLTIRRIIFSTLEKFDGTRRRLLHSSEVKQIAGRAGRFGTSFSHGVVTSLLAVDCDQLRHSLLRSDDMIEGAGIFPSREQLELLGALLDNQVGGRGEYQHSMLAEFWEDYFDHSSQSMSSDSIPRFCVEDMYRPDFIRQHFESIQVFSMHLARFMNREHESDYRSRHLRTAAERLPGKFPQTPLSILLTVFKDSVSFPSIMSTDDSSASTSDDRDDDDSREKKKKKLKKKKMKRKKQSSSEGRTAEPRSLYFVGDLDEKRQIAQVLERVSVASPGGRKRQSLTFTFRDQYVFCLAPVSVDNPEVVKVLTIIAERYLLALNASTQLSQHKSDEDEWMLPTTSVVLPKKYLTIDSKSNSAESLTKLETAHQILELYIWLGLRFPAYFREEDMKLAQQRCQQCSTAIENALRGSSTESPRHSSKKSNPHRRRL